VNLPLSIDQNAGSSAGLSVIVTLIADYFARPGLEARKERLLDRYRARREFQGLVNRILVSASAMSSDPSVSMTPAEAAIFSVQIDQQRVAVRDAANRLQDTATGFLMAESPRVRQVAARATGWILGIAVSGKTNLEAGIELLVVGGQLADLLALPKKRVLKRRAQLQQAEALFVAASTGTDPNEPQSDS